MFGHKSLTIDISNDPAIVADGARPPDRRQISVRWLIGACLTGLTSSSLMGGALFAALEGREQMATPPEIVMIGEATSQISAQNLSAQGNLTQNRLVFPALRKTFYDRKQFEVPALQKIGAHEVVRNQTFEVVNMALAREQTGSFNYPPFNALELFEDVPQPEASTVPDIDSLLYGAKIETDIDMQMREFPDDGLIFDEADVLPLQEAEQHTREMALSTGGVTKIAALAFINPLQIESLNNPSFGFSDTDYDSLDVKIVPENVSILSSHRDHLQSDFYSEDIIPLIREESIIDVLERTHYQRSGFHRLSETMMRLIGSDRLAVGSILRLGIESNRFGSDYVVRASLYRNKRHILSVALNDKGYFIRCAEPDMNDSLRAMIEGETPVIQTSAEKLPSVYDAIFRSSLSFGMSHDMAAQLVRMLANDLDMQAQISPSDSMEVLYPLDTEPVDGEQMREEEEARSRREILYVNAQFGNSTRHYYRFQTKDGRVDYYDATGRNSKQFLLRKPVPNGIFRSPFGPRKHPILGYVRMHSGVDWAAPRGTPIIAAGDGVVVKAGWSRGYGNHTEIRHANGYSTSYSHQSAFAQGIEPGVQVRQGQVIGYVGSTGLSSGPHCHFEIIVNGTRVDPMRVRLPDDNSLKGEDLIAFNREKERIDRLLQNGQTATSMVTTQRTPQGRI